MFPPHGMRATWICDMALDSDIYAGDPGGKADTGVGNYFVANYPPFSQWTPDQVVDAHVALQSPGRPNTDLGLYFHIPFCRKRCHFCYFRVYTDRNAASINAYLTAMIEEMRLYAACPVTAGRRPRFIYFGGGTPSYLSVEQLGRLAEGLQQHMAWPGVEEITFECEPGTLNRRKLEAIRDLGVTRLSLGVENFDDTVLQTNNRAHLSRQVHAAYEDAREVDFEQINIDLIAGMTGETDANWQRCLEQTIDLAPDSVTIYQMEVPYNTTLSKQISVTEESVTIADWRTKRRWVDEAFTALEADAYCIGSAYTAVRRGQNAPFVYRDALWSGADMIGLGVASFSHVSGTHFQNEHDSAPYEASLAQGELPIHRAMKMTEDQALIRQFVLQMKLGSVNPQPFRERFDVDVLERFDAPLASLEADGMLIRDAGMVRLTRRGLLRIDSLLPAFFEMEHRDVRYA